MRRGTERGQGIPSFISLYSPRISVSAPSHKGDRNSDVVTAARRASELRQSLRHLQRRGVAGTLCHQAAHPLRRGRVVPETVSAQYQAAADGNRESGDGRLEAPFDVTAQPLGKGMRAGIGKDGVVRQHAHLYLFRSPGVVLTQLPGVVGAD